jgi:multiple sugar transport system ATP-binding protein
MTPVPSINSGGLELINLCRRAGDQILVDDINLSVAPGEILALLGPSGCGKSSTLRLIAGLDPASAGEIRLGGRLITGWRPAQRQVALVFQSYALFPHMSVERNLTLGLELRGVGKEQIQRDLNQVLALLQLDALRQRRPAELSGGQRQRVALARALLRKPAVFLLDEPMSNLDAQLREELRSELRDLLHRTGVPVVYVTHDQQEAMALADRIAVLRQGQLLQHGTAQELYNAPANRFVARFLGSPSINLIDDSTGTQLGLRPERLQVQSDGTPIASGWNARPGRIVYREWLGDRMISHVSCAQGETLKVVGPQVEQVDVDGPVLVCWRVEDELRFDRSTGARVPAS